MNLRLAWICPRALYCARLLLALAALHAGEATAEVRATWSSPDPATVIATTFDANVDYSWSFLPPHPLLPLWGWFLRIETEFTPDVSGTYHFDLIESPGSVLASMTVAGTDVTSAAQPFVLTAGTRYPVFIELDRGFSNGFAALRLVVRHPGSTIFVVVPASQLSVPAPAVPGLTPSAAILGVLVACLSGGLIAATPTRRRVAQAGTASLTRSPASGERRCSWFRLEAAAVGAVPAGDLDGVEERHEGSVRKSAPRYAGARAGDRDARS